MRFRRPRAAGLLKPRGLWGDLLRGFARQIQRRRPARGGGGGAQRPGKTGKQLARARRCQCSQRAPGLQGQGRTRRPGATCSARALRAEARAQSPPGGGARLRATTSPPPQLPGAPAARGRERAVPGSAPCRTGITRRMGPAGAPGPFTGRRSSGLWFPGCSKPVCVGGRVCRTGWKKLRGCGVSAAALPLGARARRGLTDTELALGRAREPRREIWRSQVPNFRDGVPECSKAWFGPRSVSPEPVTMSRAVVCLLLGWLWLTEGSVGFWFLQRKPCACQIVGSELGCGASGWRSGFPSFAS